MIVTITTDTHSEDWKDHSPKWEPNPDAKEFSAKVQYPVVEEGEARLGKWVAPKAREHPELRVLDDLGKTTADVLEYEVDYDHETKRRITRFKIDLTDVEVKVVLKMRGVAIT